MLYWSSSWVHPSSQMDFPLESCLACLSYNNFFHLISLASFIFFLLTGTGNAEKADFLLYLSLLMRYQWDFKIWSFKACGCQALHKCCPMSLKNAGHVAFGVCEPFMACFSWLPAHTCCFTKIKAGDWPTRQQSSWGGIFLAPSPAAAQL